jgi:hypothetical protein
MTKAQEKPASTAPKPSPAEPKTPAAKPEGSAPPAEIGGPAGPEPTRYGDWERNGRVSDF